MTEVPMSKYVSTHPYKSKVWVVELREPGRLFDFLPTPTHRKMPRNFYNFGLVYRTTGMMLYDAKLGPPPNMMFLFTSDFDMHQLGPLDDTYVVRKGKVVFIPVVIPEKDAKEIFELKEVFHHYLSELVVKII